MRAQDALQAQRGRARRGVPGQQLFINPGRFLRLAALQRESQFERRIDPVGRLLAGLLQKLDGPCGVAGLSRHDARQHGDPIVLRAGRTAGREQSPDLRRRSRRLAEKLLGLVDVARRRCRARRRWPGLNARQPQPRRLRARILGQHLLVDSGRFLRLAALQGEGEFERRIGHIGRLLAGLLQKLDGPCGVTGLSRHHARQHGDPVILRGGRAAGRQQPIDFGRGSRGLAEQLLSPVDLTRLLRLGGRGLRAQNPLQPQRRRARRGILGQHLFVDPACILRLASLQGEGQFECRIDRVRVLLARLLQQRDGPAGVARLARHDTGQHGDPVVRHPRRTARRQQVLDFGRRPRVLAKKLLSPVDLAQLLRHCRRDQARQQKKQQDTTDSPNQHSNSHPEGRSALSYTSALRPTTQNHRPGRHQLLPQHATVITALPLQLAISMTRAFSGERAWKLLVSTSPLCPAELAGQRGL